MKKVCDGLLNGVDTAKKKIDKLENRPVETSVTDTQREKKCFQ